MKSEDKIFKFEWEGSMDDSIQSKLLFFSGVCIKMFYINFHENQPINKDFQNDWVLRGRGEFSNISVNWITKFWYSWDIFQKFHHNILSSFRPICFYIWWVGTIPEAAYNEKINRSCSWNCLLTHQMVAMGPDILGCSLNPFFPTVPTCAVRETASLGIMRAPRAPPLNPSETIVFWEHYRLWGV